MAARIERVRHPERNTWVVGDDDEVIVIDPAADAAPILEVVGERAILAVVCTGGAGDADCAVTVAEHDEAPIALHPRDSILWDGPADRLDIDIEDGGTFDVGGTQLEVLHTPGHTRGSVCLYAPELDAVFSGHTLLEGGPGVDDSPHVDLATILTSIGERLLTLPGGTRVLPATGEETTIKAQDARFDEWIPG